MNQMVEIAPAFKEDIKLLKPSLPRHFTQYVSSKVSMKSTFLASIVSTVPHLVFMYFHHCYNLADGISPKIFTSDKTAIKTVVELHKGNQEQLAVFFKNVSDQ